MSTLNECGLICLGGSERRKCECSGPSECRLRSHSDFPRRRLEATERHDRMLSNALEFNMKYGRVTDQFFEELVRLNSDIFAAPTTDELVVSIQKMCREQGH